MKRQHKNTEKATAVKAKSGYGKGVIILLAAVFTAIAVVLGCIFGIDNSRSTSVDNAGQGEVTTSATDRTPTSGTTTDYSTTSLLDGDTFSFAYVANNWYGITLPKGKYNLEVWGAQGGAGFTATNTGGYGGYAKASYSISSTTTLYVYVGGAGVTGKKNTSTATAGGYNGGGTTWSKRSNCSHATGSGGGATHIATTDGLLNTLETSKDKVLIVGGGGGGGGHATGLGGNGGNPGADGIYSTANTNASGGGTTSGGGECSVGDNPNTTFPMTRAGAAGTFGQGGAGAYYSGASGGGGGGGGYYGGAGGFTSTSCNGTPGGGGANYIKSGLTVLSNGQQTSVTGDGQAKITVVNQEPKTNNYSVTLGTRSSGASTRITVDNLAYDPDNPKTSIYFSNGTSGAYDAFDKFTKDSGLYLDSACSISATKYFSWTTESNTAFSIKAVKYPRAGQTSVTKDTNGNSVVTVYTKIRDNYGTGTNTRACGTISFKLTVPKETISLKTSANATVTSATGVTTTEGCVIGNSTKSAAADAPGDPSKADYIYNPNGTGISTLFVKKTLTLGGKISISASDLLSGYSTDFDRAVIAIPDTSTITPASRKFKVTQVDDGSDKINAIPAAGSGSIANAFSRISFECVTPEPGYQSLPVTVYLLEQSACNGSANVALWDSNATVSYSFQVVFKMENTRPIFRSTVSNLVDVKTGETANLSLNTYFSDVDAGSGINSGTHTIMEVIVPKKEFVLINKQQYVLDAPNYNVGYTTGTKVGETDEIFTTTATGSADTGFEDYIVYNATKPVAGVSRDQAFMSFTYSGATLSVTGLRASFSQYNPSRAYALGHFYLLMHIRDKSDELDDGIWLPIAFTVGGTAATSHTPVATVTSAARYNVTSQTAVTQFPTASGSVGDSFYFAPMAINYNGSYVVGQYKAEDEDGNNTGALTQSGLQALAMDGDNFSTYTAGAVTQGLAGWSNKLNDLLQLSVTPENVVKSVCPANECSSVNGVWANQYFYAQNINIYIEKSVVADSTYSGGRLVYGTSAAPAGSGYQMIDLPTEEIDGTEYLVIDGLKITLRSATMNRYVYAQAGVTDVVGNGVSGIKIAVRVNHTSPQAYKTNTEDSVNVATFGDKTSTRDNSYSEYAYNPDDAGAIPTFTYKIPLSGTVVITPYDFVHDYDMSVYGVNDVNGGFTLNGFSGVYENGTFTTGSTAIKNTETQRAVKGLFKSNKYNYNQNATAFLGSLKAPMTVSGVSSTTEGTLADSAIVSNASVLRDRLFFERTAAGSDAYTYNPTAYDNFVCSKSNTTNFVDVNFGTSIKIGDPVYSVDFVLITGLNRTTQPAVIELVVRDRYGSSSSEGGDTISVRIVIEVVNTKPNVKSDLFYSELSVKPISKDDAVVTPNTAELSANGNGESSGIIIDPDGDVPEFIVSRGVVIVNKQFVDDYNSNTMTKDGQDGEWFDILVDNTFEDLPVKYTQHDGVDLTRYVTAEIISKRIVSARAVSSTKAIEGGVYVAVFVTDNNGGVSIGYARIEVLNTAPVLNESETNGFDAESRLWNITSASDADITRNRYIVGSELAAEKINDGEENARDNTALDIDIKLIATDDDSMHNKTVLSQVTASTSAATSGTEYGYVNLDRNNINYGALENVVPNIINATEFNSTPAAVTVFRRSTVTEVSTDEDGNTSSEVKISYSAGTPTNFVAELNFFVGDRWYTRHQLITELSNGNLIDECFDQAGRFIVADWALRLAATQGFSSDVDLGINLSLRDQAELGGSTAGLKTAYHSNRSNKTEDGVLDNRTVVEGKLITTVYEHISKTGIRSVNEYLGVNGNYYTVESPVNNNGVVNRYISTYDGDTTTKYTSESAQNTLCYNPTSAYLTESGTVIKTRAQGSADNTLAGVYSGEVYKSGIDNKYLEGAFQYSDTIEIPAATVADSQTIASGKADPGKGDISYVPVYVPMSYFGSLSTIATPNRTEENLGEVVYPDKTFVGYNISNGLAQDRASFSRIKYAITLSDGTYEWTGDELDANPYLHIGTFDWNNETDPAKKSAKILTEDVYKYSRAYYNNRLAIATVDDKNQLIGFQNCSDNLDNFVGDGRIMYLAGQAENLIEHNYGLYFNKKNVRTSTRSLTLRINLAKYDNNEIARNASGLVDDEDTCTAEVKIHIENTKFDLFTNKDNDKTKTTALQYDEEEGTYYVDLEMSSSESAVYNLSRRANSNDPIQTGNTIEYYDDDFGGIIYTNNNQSKYDYTAKRDYVYFSSDSFSQMSRWQSGANRVMSVEGGKFTNVIATSRAQKSVANYLGVAYSTEGLAKLQESGSAYQNGTYQANAGKYGVAGKDGYSKYFNASVTEGGTRLNITAIRKTLINDIAIDENASQDDVKAIYKERGMVAEFNGTDKVPSRVYYPFNVLVYDTFGVGFNDASYVAIEFRITINNSAPGLKEVGELVNKEDVKQGRQYTMNLAVGNSTAINLYDIVYDSDIFTYSLNGVGWLATEAYFKNPNNVKDLDRETGDYLDSPLKYYNSDGQPAPAGVESYTDADGNKVYWCNGGGFVDYDADPDHTDAPYYTRDVVMWMDKNSDGDLNSNTITFKVNRRTTVNDDSAGGVGRVAVNQYRFKLTFKDSEGKETEPFTFIINITNQTPSVTQVNRSFTMRKGDDMTILASYYDVFTADNSLAYQNSETSSLVASRNEGSTGFDGTNREVGDTGSWKFEDINSDKRNSIKYNSVGEDSTKFNGFLGYVGLATDDTPWRLRITKWTTSSKLTITSEGELKLRPEGSAKGTAEQQIALHVTANAACINEPFTVELSDGEGGIITCTLYFTIVSSPPEARKYDTDTDKVVLDKAGLDGVKDDNDVYEAATYRTFIVPAEGSHKFNIDGIGEKTARKVATVRMSDVARDPDGNLETNNMRLYGNGELALNDLPLISGSDGIYRTDYFDLQVTDSGKSIVITSTGYNPDTQTGYEKLSFRIADYGDSAYENTIVITLHIYTLYSDMTNPTAATTDKYSDYLKGSEVVNVKAYDTYFNPANPTDKSKYAFVSLLGNVGNDDNALSPIVDPDATKLGDAEYNARLYAFVETKDGIVSGALSDTTLDGMLQRNKDNKTFTLNTDKDYSDYMIGGVGEGVNITSSGNVRLQYINKYAKFEFSADGTAMQFMPQAATLDKTILLYVEVEKKMKSRVCFRTDAVLRAGSLFKLNVFDSAPQDVGGHREISGAKGDVCTLTVFDSADKYGSLFMDSDNGDVVTVKGVGKDNKLAEEEYANVMSVAEAEFEGLDWKADAATGKPRAFDISVNANGLLEVKINRRVDYAIGGEYQPAVKIPLKITGEDKAGETATTVVYLTINNSDFSAVDYYTQTNEKTQVGYTFSRTVDDEYVMDVRLRYGVGNELEIDLANILSDKDSDKNYDADSFRFVEPKTNLIGGYNYLTDEDMNVSWYALDADGNPNVDHTETLAIAEPMGNDAMHRTGIRFTAVATKRDLTATMYVRVIDRAGNAEVAENGLVIKFNVTVMNDAPYTLKGMETTTLYMVGSESKEPDGMLFFIGDFVADMNDSDVVGDEASARNVDTCLRVSLQEARETDKVYSRTYEKIPENLGFSDLVLSSLLFEVTIPTTLDETLLADYRTRMNKDDSFEKDTTNRYNQWFVVKPRKGFYGEGSVDIVVLDGNANVKFDTLSTSFCINVHVISNPDEVIDKLNDVELACSKTMQMDIHSLMPDLENKLSLELNENDTENTEGDAESQGVQTSADESYGFFSQYEYYEIASIAFQNEIDENKATFTKLDDGGQLWELKAGNQVTREPVRVEVKFVLKADRTKTYKKYFYLNIVPNRAPNIKFTEIEFKRYSTDETDTTFNLSDSNTVRLEAWQLFSDPDDPEGTSIKFIDVKSQVSSIVKAQLIKDDSGEYRWLELTFVSSGESDITVTVADETGMPIQLKFKATNNDLPEASMWVKIAASFESNPVMWIVIICCSLLLIVILIIILAVLRKRKREKEELEALLVSEMEIEEQMLRLAGGPSPTDFQSFGYLAGAAGTQPDPSMMLGAGENAPQEQLAALPPAQEGMPTDGGDMPDGGNDMPM